MSTESESSFKGILSDLHARLSLGRASMYHATDLTQSTPPRPAGSYTVCPAHFSSLIPQHCAAQSLLPAPQHLHSLFTLPGVPLPPLSMANSFISLWFLLRRYFLGGFPHHFVGGTTPNSATLSHYLVLDFSSHCFLDSFH